MTDENENLIPPTDIHEYKKRKKLEKVVAELKTIIKVYGLCINALKPFSKYVIITETISVMQGNKTLLEIHLKKYESMIRSSKR